MKKLLIGLLTLFTPLAYAQDLYLGFGAGPDTLYVFQRAHIFRPGTFNAFDKQDRGGLGFFGTLFVGFKQDFHSLAVGAEVDYTQSTATSRTSNYESTNHVYSHTSFELHQHYGISLLTGFVPMQAPFTFYALVGPARGHFIVNTSDVSLEHINKWVWAIRYGLGIETGKFQNLSARLAWSRIDYNTRKMYTFDATSTVTKWTQVTAHTNQFEFSVLYHIGS